MGNKGKYFSVKYHLHISTLKNITCDVNTNIYTYIYAMITFSISIPILSFYCTRIRPTYAHCQVRG